ncbi:MAG: hypothetical protein AAGF97_18250 [Planctomycetota bacterium]
MKRQIAWLVLFVSGGSVGLVEADSYFGLEHEAVGQAVLSPVPDGVHVSNLTGGALSGVKVHYPPLLSDHEVSTLGLEDSGSLPPGTELRWDLNGQINVATPEATFATLQLSAPQDGTPGYAMELIAPQAVSFTAEYFSNGQLLTVEDLVPTSNSLQWFGSASADQELAFSTHMCWTCLPPKQVLIDIGGSGVYTDRTMGGQPFPNIDHTVIAVNLNHDVRRLTSSTLHTDAVSSFTITDESWDELVVTGDFNGDSLMDIVDLNELVGQLVGPGYLRFDLTGDGQVDQADLDQWLAVAGAANLPSGAAYLPGDANLDGGVDGLDFLAWNDHKFTDAPAWSTGDFNADGTVDGQDFLLWNDHKFMQADGVAVPEPTKAMLAGLAVLGLGLRHRRA